MQFYRSQVKYVGLLFLLAVTLSSAGAQPYAYVANGGPHNVAVLNTATNTFATYIPVSGAPNGLAVTPDGTHVYVTLGTTNSVAVISTASNSVTANISVGTNPVRVAITPDGSQAFVVNELSNNVSVIATASNTVTSTIGVGTKPIGVAFSPDGAHAYVSNSYSANVSVIDTHSRAVVSTFSTGGAYGSSGIVTVPNGNIYVANEFSNNITVHNASGTIISTITGLNYPNWLAKKGDGSKIYVSNGNGNSISVVTTASNSIAANIGVGSNPVSVAVSTDGNTAYGVLSLGSELAVISGANNSVMMMMPRVGPSPADIAMTPPANVNGGGGGGTTCSFSLGSSSISLGVGGGTGSVLLNASLNSCSWSASSDSSWLSLTSPLSGSGGTNVTFSASANTGGARTGHITVAGQTFTVNQAGAAAFTPIRVNCGGPQVTDAQGNVWAADSQPNYSMTNASIASANVPAVYQSEAWSTGTLQYQFNVANGSRTVVLKFAEYYMNGANERLFNIIVNGTTYYSSFDIMSHVAANTAYDVSIPVTVTGGQITIQLQAVKGAAKIDGIMID